MSGPSAEKDAASEEARRRFLTEPVVRPVREQACIHDSGCDGRSHSLPCNNLFYARVPSPAGGREQEAGR